MLQSWPGPYGGAPPFDAVHVADFKPALETGMTETWTEIERIANDPQPPTFANTIAALEATGRGDGCDGDDPAAQPRGLAATPFTGRAE